MHSENWDDLRYVLAVAEAGTVSGAAQALGVNHATVLRRIAAFEARHGMTFFEKTPRGYVVRSDRLATLDAAREVQTAMATLDNQLSGVEMPLQGTVRVTSTDTFCHLVLPPMVARFHETRQNLSIALICNNDRVDLARSQADLTVRPSLQLADDLDGVIAAQLGFAVYAAAQTPDAWLAAEGVISRTSAAKWQRDHIAPDKVVGSADSFLVLARLAQLGMGKAVLPCCVGAATPGLVRLDHAPIKSVPIWIAHHVDMARVSRVIEARNFLQEAFGEIADEIAGLT